MTRSKHAQNQRLTENKHIELRVSLQHVWDWEPNIRNPGAQKNMYWSHPAYQSTTRLRNRRVLHFLSRFYSEISPPVRMNGLFSTPKNSDQSVWCRHSKQLRTAPR
jgi:hypothetical protein